MSASLLFQSRRKRLTATFYFQASTTPGLQDYYKDFWTMVRTIELIAGVPCPGVSAAQVGVRHSPNVRAALRGLLPLLPNYGVNGTTLQRLSVMSQEFSCLDGLQDQTRLAPAHKNCLIVEAMTSRWQGRTPEAARPSEVAIGPSAYDDHVRQSCCSSNCF